MESPLPSYYSTPSRATVAVPPLHPMDHNCKRHSRSPFRQSTSLASLFLRRTPSPLASSDILSQEDSEREVDDGAEDGRSADQDAFLTWEDLWVTAPDGNGGTKTILEASTGYTEPGRVLAIMGPSGSGKTTLLDALAGRTASNMKKYGSILVNGRKQELAFGTSAYVMQDDVLLATLTVREIVYFAAQLRLPNAMDTMQKRERADEVIREMGLSDASDTKIGAQASRGISGGQKRRVTICLEILTRPKLLFMDEPTSGLDSAASYHMMRRITQLARHNRQTIVVSIHQPSGDVFELFDTLYLLTDGKTIYYGSTALTSEFFALNGFPCPPLRNPTDHFLKTINKNFEQENGDPTATSVSKAIDILATSYVSSIHSREVAQRVMEITEKRGAKLRKGRQASFFNQCMILTRRSTLNMYREIGYYRLRIVIYTIIAFCLGTLFFNLDYSFPSIYRRTDILGFISGFWTIMSIAGFPSFIEDLKVFKHERLNGDYGVATYVISHTLSSATFLSLISLVAGTITYSLVGFQRTFAHFSYFLLDLYMLLMTAESLMMLVASIVPGFLMSAVTGAGIQCIMILTSGHLIKPNKIPKVVWRYPIHWIAFHTYGIQGFYKNEFIGLTFPRSELSDQPTISGLELVKDVFQMQMGYSKWVDLTILFAMFVMYRIMFVVAVKIKEKTLPEIANCHLLDPDIGSLQRDPGVRGSFDRS